MACGDAGVGVDSGAYVDVDEGVEYCVDVYDKVAQDVVFYVDVDVGGEVVVDFLVVANVAVVDDCNDLGDDVVVGGVVITCFDFYVYDDAFIGC